MEEVLFALGRKANFPQGLCLVGLFIVVTLSFLTAGEVVHFFTLWNPLYIHTVGWGAWFVWQGWLFPFNRERYLRHDSAGAYRKAFYREILPGVSFGISQMLCPFSQVFLSPTAFPQSPLQIVAGLVCVCGGILLLYLGFQTIGVARASFLFEYRMAPPPLISRSVYTYIRHPLFLGGVVASLGLAFLLDRTWSLTLASLNVVVLPVYGQLEDSRLVRVFGSQYSAYCSSVGRFIPKRSVFQVILRKHLRQWLTRIQR